MKTMIIRTLFLIFTFNLSAQTFSLEEFEKIYDFKTIDRKCEYIYNEGFSKEVNTPKSLIQLSKKKFIKRTQTFDEEIIIISGDTLMYLFNDPKKYVKFKNHVDSFHKEVKTNSEKVVFENKDEIIVITEKDIVRDYSQVPIKFHTFSFYRKKKRD